MNLEERRALAEAICEMIAEGWTLFRIGETLGYSPATVRKHATFDDEAAAAYAKARDAAADVMEAEIIELAANTTNANWSTNNMKINTLKWAAARRAPRRYSERVVTDHTSSDGTMTPKPPAALDASKLSKEALDELMAARKKTE